MVLYMPLGPRMSNIAVELGLQMPSHARRTPVPTVVLSGSSTPSIWYSAFDTFPRWLSVFDNSSYDLWTYPDA